MVLSAGGVFTCGISCLHDAAATIQMKSDKKIAVNFTGVSTMNNNISLKNENRIQGQINKSKS